MKTVFIMLICLFTSSAFALKAPKGFKQEKVNIDGINFNVYKGGKGDPLLLIHGYAQSSLMWSKAMDHFKDKFTVIAPDLRGAGLSDAPRSGYDKVTMATDMKKILDYYSISKAKVVGHDIGLMVAYTLAANYPDSVEKLTVIDAFLPGIGPGDEIYNSPDLWHFRFHGEYPEKLVKGRERIYFDSLWERFSAKKGTFPEAEKKHFLSEYSRPGRMHAGWQYFVTFPQDAKTNKDLVKNKLQMPVLSIGGEKANGSALAETMKLAADNVSEVIVKDCGHWMMEECPKDTLNALDSFLYQTAQTKEAQESKE